MAFINNASVPGRTAKWMSAMAGVGGGYSWRKGEWHRIGGSWHSGRGLIKLFFDGKEIAERRVTPFQVGVSSPKFAIGASVGLVPLSQNLGNLQDALSRADAACYAAKDSGRNRVHVYDPDDRELTLRKGQMKWISRIQRALDTERSQSGQRSQQRAWRDSNPQPSDP